MTLKSGCSCGENIHYPFSTKWVNDENHKNCEYIYYAEMDTLFYRVGEDTLLYPYNFYVEKGLIGLFDNQFSFKKFEYKIEDCEKLSIEDIINIMRKLKGNLVFV